MELNRDTIRRAEILGIAPITPYAAGIIPFEWLALEDLETLFEGKFIDPEDRQNEAPTAGEFLEFMRKHPHVFAHGYAASPERSDYRITIEGLMAHKAYLTPQAFEEFIIFCRHADELELGDHLRSWWD